MTVKAILSIILFVVTYIFLIFFALGITILSGYFGILIIGLKVNVITIMLGAGLISMGLLTLLFVLKFIFTKNKSDRSHLTEITKSEQPELFEFIEDIVKQVKTDFPKRVYLSSEVNASVFYDSNFWSMILPVRKNLQIGLGLVNVVTVEEFRAILAHEFGHFSQRTMKVGSYVYNVNQVIYNMLYDNESYMSLAQKWANINGYFSFFVLMAVRITQGVQWLLQKVYNVVNLSYLGLSREMEFHADEVAANVAGSEPLVTSLLRLGLADNSYNEVINYYSNKIGDNIKPSNIYPQHLFVLRFIGNEGKLPEENNLPLVDANYLNRYNKSKLIIKDQWSSHPRTEDRVVALQKLNIVKNRNDSRSAHVLFSNAESIQSKITEKLFSEVIYAGELKSDNDEDFSKLYVQLHKEATFDTYFNTYYDYKNPLIPEDEYVFEDNSILQEELFSPEKIDLLNTLTALQNDIESITVINSGTTPIKSFDYDGMKYSPKKCDVLLDELKEEIKSIEAKIYQNDLAIHSYFTRLASQQGKKIEIESKFKQLSDFDKDYILKIETYNTIVAETEFVQYATSFETIEQNFRLLKISESKFKSDIESLLKDSKYSQQCNDAIRTSFRKMLDSDLIYFEGENYNDEALQLLFECLNYYHQVISKTFFKIKKELLDYKVELVQNTNIDRLVL